MSALSRPRHSEPDQEVIRRRPFAQPEHRLQRGPLRRREAGDPVEQRRAQLMQRGEGQLHLGLHAGGSEHPDPGRRGRRVAQQG
jgi:hypothetical protein